MLQKTTVSQLERQLLEVIDLYRSMIIDPIEQEMGDSPNWQYIRSRLLKALGDRGLSGRIREIVSFHESTGERSAN